MHPATTLPPPMPAAAHYVLAAAEIPALPTALPAAAPARKASAMGGDKAAGTALPLPEPARLLYEVRAADNSAYTASGELLWQPDAGQYTARLEMAAFGFRLRTWTSQGGVGATGLLPLRFADKPRGAELSTHFQRSKGVITFSENTLEVPLQPGAQDKLSALLQLSVLVAANPAQYPAGSFIRFQAADAHRAEVWGFKASAAETLSLPGGALSALKFTKEPTPDFDQRIEVWLAPTLQYLPVRLRITETNGDFADMQWKRTQKPL